MDYKLKNGILFLDNKMSICPIAPGLLVPSKTALNQQTLLIQRFGCSELCPHFSREGNNITLKCAVNNNEFILSEDIRETQKNNKLLN